MKTSLYRERALLKFQRYYMHGIRNGEDFEKASTEALWKAREEILAEIHDDKSFENDAEREELWSQCMEMILIFKMVLKRTPIDSVKLEEMRGQIKEEEEEIEKQLAATFKGTATEALGAAVVTGLQELTKKEGEEKNGP